jgi:hypothetical protein
MCLLDRKQKWLLDVQSLHALYNHKQHNNVRRVRVVKLF